MTAIWVHYNLYRLIHHINVYFSRNHAHNDTTLPYIKLLLFPSLSLYQAFIFSLVQFLLIIIIELIKLAFVFEISLLLLIEGSLFSEQSTFNYSLSRYFDYEVVIFRPLQAVYYILYQKTVNSNLSWSKL